MARGRAIDQSADVPLVAAVINPATGQGCPMDPSRSSRLERSKRRQSDRRLFRLFDGVCRSHLGQFLIEQ